MKIQDLIMRHNVFYIAQYESKNMLKGQLARYDLLIEDSKLGELKELLGTTKYFQGGLNTFYETLKMTENKFKEKFVVNNLSSKKHKNHLKKAFKRAILLEFLYSDLFTFRKSIFFAEIYNRKLIQENISTFTETGHIRPCLSEDIKNLTLNAYIKYIKDFMCEEDKDIVINELIDTFNDSQDWNIIKPYIDKFIDYISEKY